MPALCPSQMIEGSRVSAHFSRCSTNGASQLQASVPVRRMPRSSQIHGRFVAHAAAGAHVVRLAVPRAGAVFTTTMSKGCSVMADARELVLDFGCRNHLAVRKMAEVEFHAGTETPVERHLVDGDRALPLSIVEWK